MANLQTLFARDIPVDRTPFLFSYFDIFGMREASNFVIQIQQVKINGLPEHWSLRVLFDRCDVCISVQSNRAIRRYLPCRIRISPFAMWPLQCRSWCSFCNVLSRSFSTMWCRTFDSPQRDGDRKLEFLTADVKPQDFSHSNSFFGNQTFFWNVDGDYWADDASLTLLPMSFPNRIML